MKPVRVWASKHMFDMFPMKNGLKQWDPLAQQLCFRICSWEGTSKPGGLVVYSNDVTILGGSIHTIKKNTETSVVIIKEIGVEVRAE